MKDASVATCSQVPSRRTRATQTDFGKLHAATQTTSHLVSTSTQTDGGGIELSDSNSDVHSCDSSTCSDAPSDVGSIDLASDVSGSDSEDVEDTEGWTDARSCQLNVCLAYVDSIRKLVGFCPLTALNDKINSTGCAVQFCELGSELCCTLMKNSALFL